MFFRKILEPRRIEVLPYLGGNGIHFRRRRYRVSTPLRRGWWRFELDGSMARALEPSQPRAPEPSQPHTTVLCVGQWGFALNPRAGEPVVTRVHFVPLRSREPFQRVAVRLWHDGATLYDHHEVNTPYEQKLAQALKRVQAPPLHVSQQTRTHRLAYLYAWLCASLEADHETLSAQILAPRLAQVVDGQLCANQMAGELALELSKLSTHKPSGGEGAAAGLRNEIEAKFNCPTTKLIALRRLDDRHRCLCLEVDGYRVEAVIEISTLTVIDPGVEIDTPTRTTTLADLPRTIRAALSRPRRALWRH